MKYINYDKHLPHKIANKVLSDHSESHEMVPVFSRWFGSWKISLQRRAYSTLELCQKYDRAASGWEQMLERIGYPRAYENLLQLGLVNGIAFKEKLQILDCGVGTGAMSYALTDVLGSPFRLEAIDISNQMLIRARRRLCEAGLPVLFRQADITQLPYGNETFDMVMTAHVLEHLVDPQKAIKEMVRVLKPGGLLLACVTKRSFFGALIHLKWRTHRLHFSDIKKWLIDQGLEEPRQLSLAKHKWFTRLSVGCIGRKPSTDNETVQ